MVHAKSYLAARVSCTTKIKKKRKKRSLSNAKFYIVSGEAKSGQIVALMGNSGAGKTTLLEALSGRLPSQFVMSGEIKVNGTIFSKRIVFVEQFPETFSYMTVREFLTYQVLLRHEFEVNKDLELEIDRLLSKMALDACQSSLIGEIGLDKVISGGERKKLAIAAEVVGNASILFLDEPTTGLDSFAAIEVVKILRRLAKENNAIVMFSIHQPSFHVANMFDKIILLSDSGRVAFEGHLNSALSFFEKRNLCSIEFHTGTLSQIRTLFWRESLFIRRNIELTLGYIVPLTILVYVILIYGKQKLNRGGTWNLNSIICLFIRLIPTYVMTISAVTTAIWTPFLRKDYKNGLYGVGIFMLSRMVFEIPIFCFIQIVFTSALFYWTIGLQEDLYHFGMFLVLMILTTLGGHGTGQFIGSICPTTTGVMIFLSFLNPLQDIFMGYMIRINSITFLVRWFRYLNFPFYGYHTVMINQWRDIEDIECEFENKQICFPDGSGVLKDYGVDKEEFLHYIIYLILLNLVYRALTYVILLIKVSWG